MGQLEKARLTRDKANIRAVREAAVVAILNDENCDLETNKKFYVTGSVDDNGDLTIDKISTSTEVTESTPGKISYTDGKATIYVVIEAKDLAKVTS